MLTYILIHLFIQPGSKTGESLFLQSWFLIGLERRIIAYCKESLLYANFNML